jgi:hypothetical protein
MRLLVKVSLKMGVSWKPLTIGKKRTDFKSGEINFDPGQIFPYEEGGFYRGASYLGQSGILVRSGSYYPRFYFVSTVQDFSAPVYRFAVPNDLQYSRKEIFGIDFYPLPIPQAEDGVIELIVDKKKNIFLLEKFPAKWTLSAYSSKEEGMDVDGKSYVSMNITVIDEFPAEAVDKLAAARKKGLVLPTKGFEIFKDLGTT